MVGGPLRRKKNSKEGGVEQRAIQEDLLKYFTPVCVENRSTIRAQRRHIGGKSEPWKGENRTGSRGKGFIHTSPGKRSNTAKAGCAEAQGSNVGGNKDMASRERRKGEKRNKRGRRQNAT